VPGESLEAARRLLGASRVEADLVLLPEYSDVAPAGLSAEELRRRARGLGENVFVEGLVGLAAEHGAVFVAGVLERDAGCVYSTVVAVLPSGRVEPVYRKAVLFDALGYRESSILCPGGWGPGLLALRGLRLGVLVCFELRFPELARALAAAGADALLVSAAWYHGPGKEEQLRFLAQARASENTVYLFLSDQAPPVFAGRSMAVDPYGHVMLDLGHRLSYSEAVLDEGVVADARERLPLLRLRGRAVEAASRAPRLLEL
jgi:predicted amidohydrolase